MGNRSVMRNGSVMGNGSVITMSPSSASGQGSECIDVTVEETNDVEDRMRFHYMLTIYLICFNNCKHAVWFMRATVNLV